MSPCRRGVAHEIAVAVAAAQLEGALSEKRFATSLPSRLCGDSDSI